MDLWQGEASAGIALQPWCGWDAREQSPFLRAEDTGACTQERLSLLCRVSQSHPWPEVQISLSVIPAVCLFPPADPDSQLYDMGYTPEEEAPACPDEFDDFVTFEASVSSLHSHK